MAHIKSALEIALERTREVEGDKESLVADEARKQGKMVVSRFLNEPDYSLKDGLASIDKGKRTWAQEGMLEVLLANLVLPQDQLGAARIDRIAEAFSTIKQDRRAQQMFKQLSSFFDEYVEERDRVREMVTQQYAPRLRQKEQELSQRMGQPVHIDPMSDPDFQSLLRKSMAQLEQRYGSVLRKVKEDLRTIYGA